MDDVVLRALLLIASSLALIVSGILRRPGYGILFTLALVGFLAFREPQFLRQLGFRHPDSWPLTILLGLLIGSFLGLFAMAFVEPLAERIMGQPHDISVVEDVRGDFSALIRWLVIVWLTVGLLEELLYRGYLMTEFIYLFGASSNLILISLLASSIIFGVSHLYQGPSGFLSSSFLGLIIGIIFFVSAFNLWLVILIHGFIDTIQLYLISTNHDEAIRTRFVSF